MKVLCIVLQLIQETSTKRKRKSDRFIKVNKDGAVEAIESY